MPWGARQEVDFTHPVFRFHAERVIRAVIAPIRRPSGRHRLPGRQRAGHASCSTTTASSSGSCAGCCAQYGDVDTLNREWGLTYWSHRLADWSDLWRPDGNTFPQYDLAWRRYQADLTTEFIAWQAGLVREYAQPDQFVTTCLAYPRPALDDEQLCEALDVTAGNPYYGMQDRLDATLDLDAGQPLDHDGRRGAASGRPTACTRRSRRGTSSPRPTPSRSAAPTSTFPPYPGQLKQAAFAFISRGAAMIEYWHWHTLPYGTETYWGGVLPHSLVPGRVYRELAEIGAALEPIGTTLDGFEPDADVAILWSNDSRFALQFSPPLATPTGQPDRASYEHIVDAFHRGVVDSGRQSRILHVPQALALGAAELAARFPVLVAPALYVASDDDLALLREYAAAGGHLVVGIRTGYADEEARARVEVAPARLTEAAGVRYEEFSNLRDDVPVSGSGPLAASVDAVARRWIDGLIADGAETLARYDHPRFGDFPAVTTNEHGVRPHHGRRHRALTRAGRRHRPLGGAVADRRRTRRARAGRHHAGDRRVGRPPRRAPRLVRLQLGMGAAGDHARGFRHRPRHRRPLRAGTKVSLPAWSTRTFVSQ